MKIEFQRVIIDNFTTFVGHHVFDLVDRGPGLHYIYGTNLDEPTLESNGSGKSTLFDALAWCQFGRTTDGRKGPELKPRHHKGTLCVTNVMLIDGKQVAITRQHNPNTLTMNDKPCTQEDIDALMPFDLFTSTVLIGQGQPLFFDLKPSAKMDLFSDGLDLDRWDARSVHTKKKMEDLERVVAKDKASVEHWKTVRDQLSGTIDKLQKHIASWTDEQQERLSSNRKELTSKKAELEKQILIRDKASLAYDGAGTEVGHYRNLIDDLDEKLDKANRKKDALDLKIQYDKQAIKNLKNDLGNVEDADKCPTCGQKITGSELSKHRKEILTKIHNLEFSVKTSITCLPTGIIDKITANRVAARAAMKGFQDKEDDARSTLDRLIPVTAKLEAEIKTVEDKIESDESTVNPFQEQMQFNRRAKTEAVGKIRDLEDLTLKNESRIERLKVWVKGFKDIRLYIIDEVLKELEYVTNNILDEVGLVDWTVKYSVERETQAGTMQRGLNVYIQGPRDKSPVKWQCWSKGEGQRLRLVGAMALSDVLLAHAGIETNLEIYDEPTIFLTSRGIDDLCELLSQRAEMSRKIVFFIDHKAVESSYFTSTLKVVKSKDGKSRLT